MTVAFASIVAHQGGWDEALLVATPVLIIGALLMLANRRASKALASMQDRAEAASNDTSEPNGAPNRTADEVGDR